MSDTLDWMEHHEIVRTINRYFRLLDERRFEPSLFAQLFTERAEVRRPNGTVLIGPEGIASSHAKSMARFRVTQHLLTGHDVDIQGDAATVRINLVAVHLWEEDGNPASMLGNHFAAGGVVHATLEKRTDGWRIRSVAMQVVWRDGKDLQRMLQTDRG